MESIDLNDTLPVYPYGLFLLCTVRFTGHSPILHNKKREKERVLSPVCIQKVVFVRNETGKHPTASAKGESTRTKLR
ncbi:MAG: hypothetical protein Pg6B_11300 [Candidatus Azobacteroides pseudotrichonymphae]|nr:MAG: hypothetical protein Pg6B_11300 [Candidatus Azobacteroides pseudotrichonymphae]